MNATRSNPRRSQEMAGAELADRAFCLSANSPWADDLDVGGAGSAAQEQLGNDLAVRTSPGTMPKERTGASRAGDELSRRAFSLSMASPEALPSNEAGEDLASRIRM